MPGTVLGVLDTLMNIHYTHTHTYIHTHTHTHMHTHRLYCLFLQAVHISVVINKYIIKDYKMLL